MTLIDGALISGAGSLLTMIGFIWADLAGTRRLGAYLTVAWAFCVAGFLFCLLNMTTINGVPLYRELLGFIAR